MAICIFFRMMKSCGLNIVDVFLMWNFERYYRFVKSVQFNVGLFTELFWKSRNTFYFHTVTLSSFVFKALHLVKQSKMLLCSFTISFNTSIIKSTNELKILPILQYIFVCVYIIDHSITFYQLVSSWLSGNF